MMEQQKSKETLKCRIEEMREELNKIVIADTEKTEIVRVSQELDDLINEYYCMSEE